MDLDSLTATTNSQSQSTTQSPQSSTQAPGGGTQSGSVQPGTATDLLSGGSGVGLHGSTLPTVNLPAASSATAHSEPAPVVTHHHIAPGLFVFPLLFVIVAAILVWTTARSVKSTT